jgi:hypothetical protein
MGSSGLGQSPVGFLVNALMNRRSLHKKGNFLTSKININSAAVNYYLSFEQSGDCKFIFIAITTTM